MRNHVRIKKPENSKRFRGVNQHINPCGSCCFYLLLSRLYCRPRNYTESCLLSAAPVSQRRNCHCPKRLVGFTTDRELHPAPKVIKLCCDYNVSYMSLRGCFSRSNPEHNVEIASTEKLCLAMTWFYFNCALIFSAVSLYATNFSVSFAINAAGALLAKSLERSFSRRSM